MIEALRKHYPQLDWCHVNDTIALVHLGGDYTISVSLFGNLGARPWDRTYKAFLSYNANGLFHTSLCLSPQKAVDGVLRFIQHLDKVNHHRRCCSLGRGGVICSGRLLRSH